MLSSVLMWFRRDLRDYDNVALAEALRRAERVYCVFVFDTDILKELKDPEDRRVEFIVSSIEELQSQLRLRNTQLIVRHGSAFQEITTLAQQLGVSAVFTNRDYEPSTKARDQRIANALKQAGIGFEHFKDQVIFDGMEILTKSDRPFTVFTPYKRAWLARLTEEGVTVASATQKNLSPIPPHITHQNISLNTLGFKQTNLAKLGIKAGMSGAQELLDHFRSRIEKYDALRDYPAKRGVSYLSVHLRFGTISLRELVNFALTAGALRENAGAATWLSELIWRDFYFMILDHFPHVVTNAFKPECDAINWEENSVSDEHFSAWCEGKTGYPIIDAAMRQLNQTGYMHNRLRMISASFLTKDLGIHWQKGEAYFAHHLNDFDLAANNGGWQWSASTGCDAQPYFRIFNPITQSERFDPKGDFIRRYIPELEAIPDKFIHAPWKMSFPELQSCGVILGKDTPHPIVEHDKARKQTLARFNVAKKQRAD